MDVDEAGIMRHLSSITLCLIGCLVTGNAVFSFAVASVVCLHLWVVTHMKEL